MISVFSKGKKLHSIIYNLCPRCHSGKFWSKDNPYLNVFTKSNNNLEKCDKCNLQYEIEPGFWYGAMYVSYALGVGTMLLSWMLIELLVLDLKIHELVLAIVFFIVLFSPFFYFYSRLIWINFFVNYEIKKNEEL